jgi:hypothetical protein
MSAERLLSWVCVMSLCYTEYFTPLCGAAALRSRGPYRGMRERTFGQRTGCRERHGSDAGGRQNLQAYRTTATSMIFFELEEISEQKERLVALTGIEPVFED